MRDLALYIAGALAMAVAIAHGLIAEVRVFNVTRIEPRRVRGLLRMVWQATTVDWLVLGALLIVAPAFESRTARDWVIAAAVVAFSYAAVGNAVATRGRHIGWALMCGVIALALFGH